MNTSSAEILAQWNADRDARIAAGTCTYGRCTRKAVYDVTETLLDGTTSQTSPMCSPHKVASTSEGWTTGSSFTTPRR
jgi:hypothetical protein